MPKSKNGRQGQKGRRFNPTKGKKGGKKGFRGSPQKGSKGGRRTGKGGKGGNRKNSFEKPKTAEELDAMMDAYWKKGDPKVAQARPISSARSMPCCSMNVGAHAMAVPWPPLRLTEPVNRPATGGAPMDTATATPTRFWMNR